MHNPPVEEGVKEGVSLIQRIGEKPPHQPREDCGTRDEGYSTMSSDIPRDPPTPPTVATVLEERSKGGEHAQPEEKGEIQLLNTKNLQCSPQTAAKKVLPAPVSDFDGLRTYDYDDDNSDILMIPIRGPIVIQDISEGRVWRSVSDSLLCAPQGLDTASVYEQVGRGVVNVPERSISLLDVTFQITRPQHESLRRAVGHPSLKKDHRKKRDRDKVSSEIIQSHNDQENHYRTNGILSPSYSRAEMEDWSLDLSAEDIRTPAGDTDPSLSESCPTQTQHSSLPSVQGTTLDLEEDHNELLWNGATYLKGDQDQDNSWPYKKDQLHKAWQLKLDGSKEGCSMMSPRSGCSDQPAIWSSSEQLSCCSEVASKCSTDIENFCEQLCNLPELKRVSFCSSDNGGVNESSLNSNYNSSIPGSIDDQSELVDDVCVDTVFTRDFYRLVKFESTKSLAASSKSLETSDGLTIERLQGLETNQTCEESLASVLGFIAEQQKYCKEREVKDQEVTSGLSGSMRKDKSKSPLYMEKSASSVSSVICQNQDGSSSATASFDHHTSEVSLDSHSEHDFVPELQSKCRNLKYFESQSLTKKDKSSDHVYAVPADRQSPSRPKRSASLQLSSERNFPSASRRRRPLSSGSSAPFCSVASHCNKTPATSTSVYNEPAREVCNSDNGFPPPPDFLDSCSKAIDPPAVPPHGPMALPVFQKTPTVSSVPHRCSIQGVTSDKIFNQHKIDNSCDSPPVPKRITSRALPRPPLDPPSAEAIQPIAVPKRSTSLLNEIKRPQSLLKENSKIAKPKKDQLNPACRNSATLLIELQRMAKAEEDEKVEVYSPPEATSPGPEAGLGTGWVRVEPIMDLRDPQVRNFLFYSLSIFHIFMINHINISI